MGRRGRRQCCVAGSDCVGGVSVGTGTVAEAQGPRSGRPVERGSVAEWTGSEVARKATPCGRGRGRLCGLRGPLGWGQLLCGFAGLRDHAYTGGSHFQVRWAELGTAQCVWGVWAARHCPAGASPGEGGRSHLALSATSVPRGGRARRGAQGLGAAREKVMCGPQKGIHVEVAQRIPRLLRG